MTGRTLAHYRIDAKLGAGGMGEVYKSHDARLDRAVAIKIISADKVADPRRKQRFIQEAKAASALNHPNIVTVHDIGHDAGVDFLVMEYVKGKTLEEVIPSKGLRPAKAVSYAVQIADALTKAHDAGILHRDLKPSNIMVTPEGRIKILDFGLAKLLEPPDWAPGESTLTARPLTDEGTVLGTAPYMSPEQAEGRALDRRSEVFSLGSVVYEMATGRRPFTSDTRLSLLNRIVHEDAPPPAQLNPSIPLDLEKIILRCLRKDPTRRFQTMADLKVALEDLQAELASAAQPPAVGTPVLRRWAWVVLLPVLLGAGILAWRRWPRPPPAQPLQARELTTFPGVKAYPTFSPDGNHVAFTWTGAKQDNYDVYVQLIGAGSPPLRLTADPAGDFNAAWSPDGRWIAFLRGSPTTATPGMSDVLSGTVEVRLIPPLGGPERKLAELRFRESYVGAAYLAWCPESDCLVVTDSTGQGKPDALFVLALDTGEKRQLTQPRPPAVGDTSPAVSPGGRALVFKRHTAVGAGELLRLPLGKGMSAGGELTRLAHGLFGAAFPAWMPGGEEVLFSARGDLWRADASGQRPPERLPFVGQDGWMAAVSSARRGGAARLVYLRSFADSNIWQIGVSAGGATASSPPAVSIASTRADSNPQLSPDGHRVAFTSNRAGDSEIWVANRDGSDAVQLTAMGALTTGTPRWSPDGNLIAFDSNPEGQHDIYLVPSTGGKSRRLTTHPASDHVPSFSRDGKWIYFSSNRTGKNQIWKAPASGGEAVQITHNEGYVAFESPDGAWLYYTQRGGGSSSLWRLPAGGGQPVKLLDGVVFRAFTLVETGVYYLDRVSRDTRLRFMDPATGKSITVAAGLGNVSHGLTATADGRTVLYTRVDSSVNDLMLVEDFR